MLAICRAAQVLTAAGVLEGRTFPCYPAVSPDVLRAGGSYAEIPMDQACADGASSRLQRSRHIRPGSEP